MFIKDLVLDVENPKHKAVIAKYSTTEYGGVSLLRPSGLTKKKSPSTKYQNQSKR